MDRDEEYSSKCYRRLARSGQDNANMSSKYFCANDNYKEYLTGVLMRKTGKTILRRKYLQLRVLI